MPELIERVAKLEEKTIEQGMSIIALEKNFEEQKKQLTEILSKLNTLVYNYHESNNTYNHHKLICQGLWDSRYLLKTDLKRAVEEVVKEISQEKISNTKNVSYIIYSIMNIAWKAVVIGGGIYAALNLFGV